MTEEIKDPRKEGQHVRCDLWVDDLHVCLIWNEGRVKTTIRDTSGLQPGQLNQIELDLSPEEAGALSFIFITGEGYADADILEQLYELLEPRLVNIPQNLRPIP